MGSSLSDRFGGYRLVQEQKKAKKQRAIRDAGKKIKGKEAKKLKAMGVTKKDIRKYRHLGGVKPKLSRKGKKVYADDGKTKTIVKKIYVKPKKKKDKSMNIKSNVTEYKTPFSGKGSGGSNFEKQIKSLNEQIAAMQKDFRKQSGALTDTMLAERKAYQNQIQNMQGDFANRFSTQAQEFQQQMAEKQGEFQQQMAASQGTPRVEGIRFADYGTGGATRQQLARRGVGGTFNRMGDRLLQISSLNV